MFHFVPNEYVKANLTWHSSDLYSFKTMFNYHHYLIYFFVFFFTNCYWYQWYLFCVQYSLHNMLIHAKLLIIYMYYIGRFYLIMVTFIAFMFMYLVLFWKPIVSHCTLKDVLNLFITSYEYLFFVSWLRTKWIAVKDHVICIKIFDIFKV